MTRTLLGYIRTVAKTPRRRRGGQEKELQKALTPRVALLVHRDERRRRTAVAALRDQALPEPRWRLLDRLVGLLLTST